MIRIVDWGRVEYDQTLAAMRRFTDSRNPQTTDEIWLVEHSPVYTLGQAGKPEHILAAGEIPVIRVERGGQVTYHGPGQLIAYILLDLRRNRFTVRDLVCRLEQAMIDTLASFGVSAQRQSGAPGVYLADPPLLSSQAQAAAPTTLPPTGAKIGALGLKIRQGCCFHGLALNIDMDLTPFAGINPCGYQGMVVTQLADLVSQQARRLAHGDTDRALFDAAKRVLTENLQRVVNPDS